MQHIHFIAIGGAAMHNLALALHDLGNKVTGSDDEIKDPSLSRLKRAGILPSDLGWYPEKLDAKPDIVILGMHARADNPELLRAKELGLKVFSFPEYFYEHAKNKIRVVIGGSHGKTSITAMIMYALKHAGIEFDYMVGSTISGFDNMVRLSDSAKFMVIEGDEYLASPIDRRPKFHLYRPHIALLSGIAWDHVNVFPTFENYLDQFRIFAQMIPDGGTLIYYDQDDHLNAIAAALADGVNKIPYHEFASEIQDGITTVLFEGSSYEMQIFGKHNLANMRGAIEVCKLLGLEHKNFLQHLTTFTGAARRLELVKKENDLIIYRDFAHSPSKLKATLDSVRTQYPDWHLVACMELHTFSSLNAAFLDEYQNTMDAADVPIVFYNPSTIEHKKLPPISASQVQSAFQNTKLEVFTNPSQLHNKLKNSKLKKTVLLMMSSGTFEGLDISSL